MSVFRREDAEKAILGGILLHNSAYAEASQLGLKPSDFSLDSHRRIYERMVEVAECGQPVDVITDR